MYAPKIIKSKLDAIQSQISKRPKHQQYNLTYFSIEQSQYYTRYLLSLIEGIYVPGKPKSWKFPDGVLTQNDYNFIENEIFLSQNDAMYWMTHYAYIKSKLTDETESIILFSPNIAQRIIMDCWAESEAQFHAIMMLYLKARQGGVSTINELEIARRVQFFGRTNALVASSDPDKTKKMASMMQLAWDLQPPWMIGEYTIATSREQWAYFPETKSSVTCQHGTSMSGIARGDTPDVFHISEVPDFSDPEEDIDASLLNAVHENPFTFGVLESTAKGKTGKGKYWYDKWVWAINNYHRNRTRLRPVFLPYYIFTDVWPTKTWWRQFGPKNPKDWKPKKTTLLHAEACKRATAESPLLRKYLGDNWTLPIQQQYWWEFTRAEHEESDTLHKFLEEACSSWQEAFQRSGKGLITIEQAEYLRNAARPLATYQGKPAVFGIVGHGIPSEHEPDLDHVDTSRDFITIKTNWDETERIYRLIPLHHDPDIWEKRLFIWELPFPNKNYKLNYSTGIDGSDGLEGLGDNSAIEIIKKGSPLWPAEQIGEFCSNSLSTSDLLPHSLAIGTFFSCETEDGLNQCRQVVELNAGGRGLQHSLRLAGWSTFHHWEGAYDSIKRRTTNKIGWETNAWTRPFLTVDMVRLVKTGFFRLNSPYLIEELLNIQKGDDNQRIEAKGEDHDDRFFAAMFGCFSLHVWELYLMSKGDSKIMKMFKSFNDMEEVLKEEETLAEVITKIEKTKPIGRSKEYIMDRSLPTLD